MKYSLDKFLKIRPRSELEIRQKLKYKKFSESEINKQISNLKKQDIINDKRFAQFWINYRTEYKIRGKKFIEFELKQKGIKKEIIDDLLQNYNEAESILEIAREKYQLLKNENPIKRKQKLFGYLLRRGFSYDIARNAINDIIEEEYK